MNHPSEIRSNVERQVQKIWGGTIAIYLFLGGLGAGAYFVSGVATLLGIDKPAWNETAMAGVSVSWVVVGIGLLFLASHLGKPLRAPWAVSKVRSSWISRGVIFFTAFGILALIHTFAGLEGPALVTVVVLGMLFALMTMAYTGALLSSSKGYPLWRTSILPLLFLVSGAVTGLALVIVAAVVANKTQQLGLHQIKLMCLAGAISIVVELLAIMSFMNSAYKQADSREAASRMLRSAGFLWGDLVLGLTAPLILLFGAYFGVEDKSTALGIASLASILILVGGYMLRHSILSAGMASTLQTAGFTFRPIANPDFVVSEFGKLPPS